MKERGKHIGLDGQLCGTNLTLAPIESSHYRKLEWNGWLEDQAPFGVFVDIGREDYNSKFSPSLMKNFLEREYGRIERQINCLSRRSTTNQKSHGMQRYQLMVISGYGLLILYKIEDMSALKRGGQVELNHEQPVRLVYGGDVCSKVRRCFFANMEPCILSNRSKKRLYIHSAQGSEGSECNQYYARKRKQTGRLSPLLQN